MQGDCKNVYIYIYVRFSTRWCIYTRHVYTEEPSIPTRFPECPALTSSNNNNNKKGWRPRFNQRVCLPDVINSKRAQGRRARKGKERERMDGRQRRWKGKTRDGCCHFRCLSYHGAGEGLDFVASCAARWG